MKCLDGGRVQNLFDLIDDVGFLHIGPGAFFFGHPSRLFISSGRDDNDPRRRRSLFSRFQYFPSIRLWHDQVSDDEVKVLCRGRRNGLLPILNRDNVIAFLAQGLGQGPSDQVLIVGD